MKVAELIEDLKKQDQNDEVCIYVKEAEEGGFVTDVCLEEGEDTYFKGGHPFEGRDIERAVFITGYAS
jgi:hypothetical protein